MVPFWRTVLGMGEMEKGGRGTDSHADAAVAFLNVFVAAADGIFGLKGHGHVAAVAASSICFAVFDFGCRLGPGEGVGLVAGLEVFAFESVMCEFW
jgi:hypothetical protein